MEGSKKVLRILSVAMFIAALAWGFEVWRQVQATDGDGPPIGAIFVAFPAFILLIGAGALWSSSSHQPLRMAKIDVIERVFVTELNCYLAEYDIVELAMLNRPLEAYDGWKDNIVPPKIGDRGTIVDISERDGVWWFIVEGAFVDNAPTWIGDFTASELRLVPRQQ